MSLIACEKLTCAYDDVVLHDVDFALEPGVAVALLGPNGSGKSTFLKALTKTLAPRSGTVLVNGARIQDLSFRELARLVAHVPQEEPVAFPFLVRDIVTMGRLAFSTGMKDTPEDVEAARKAMEIADCCDLAERRMTELSGGEKQRVLIARALAQQTPVLLLDEPTSHLDVNHQISIAALLRSLAEQGKGIVAAVHDLNLAGRFASRAVLLSRGRVVLDAPLKAVLGSPMLDRTYGVSFERIERDSELPLLVAKESASRQS